MTGSGEDRLSVLPFEAVNAPPGTRNIMLTISYDGTAYKGWQVQPNGESVQSCVERAVEAVTGERRRVYCAGRTDAGVHALGQVANFFTVSRIPIQNVRLALQTHLPTDISIVSAQEVSLAFHATFSAVRKRYRYLIHDGEVCPPFLKNYCQQARVRLDVDRMHEAAQALLGTHDFRCFEKEYPNKQSSVRTIMDAVVRRVPSWDMWQSTHHWRPAHPMPGRPLPDPDESPFLMFEVMADGFLYNMVRSIVGTLTDIGRGKRPVSYLRHVIESLDRSVAGMTAVPQGLYMVYVEYPPELLQASPPAST